VCGICGIWHRDGRAVDRACLAGMNELLAHRGPDGEGVLCEGEIGFGHRRLSIVDLSDRAAQPMATPDGGLWLTFNGEIHNFTEVRCDLEARGVDFRSTSDSEVLLWAFREWGSDCFVRLNGMWGVAIWDARRRELILSRDRFGIKPVCWSIRGDRVAFASEAKAIAGVFSEEKAINECEVAAFLSGACPDGSSDTFFANIQMLPPASFAVIGREGSPQIETYWELEPSENPNSDAAEELRWLLEDSIRLRMRSDVPVGACVSGGLDSTSIIRLAAPLSDRRIHCFSFRNQEPAYDESRFAAIAAGNEDDFDLHWVSAGPDGMLDIIDKIVWHHDAPRPARGRFPQWFTFEEASRHVKVVLDGQAADEMLAGYLGHVTFPYLLDAFLGGADPSRPTRSWKQRLREPLELAGKLRPPLRSLLRTPISPVVRRFSRRVWPAHRVMNPALMARTEAPPSRRFFDSWLCPDVERPYSSHLNNALWVGFHWAGLPEILHAEDALGMAHGVEARPVFLDHRLVELCFSLPYHEKIRDGWGKSVLRRAMEGIVPPEIIGRRVKMGYPAPIYQWLATEPNISMAEDLLLGPDRRSRGLVDRRGLARLLRGRRERPVGGSAFGTELVWRCLTLELWLRRFGMGG